MYIVERNKVTIEDLKDQSLFPDYNAGLLQEQPLVSIFNLIYKHFIKDTIYMVLIEIKEELDKIEEDKRPPLAFNMVYLKLLGKEVVTSEKIIGYYKEYIEYRKFLCDNSCGKWSIFDIAELPQVYLTDTEKQEVEFDNIEAYLDEFIEFFDYPEDFDDQDTYVDYKYYKFAKATYNLIDFSNLLPTTLRYEGFYSINDGGQGIYKRSNDNFYDIGVVQKIKGLYYRRQYNRWVYSWWFGMQRKVEGVVLGYLIKYPNIKFTNAIHVRLDETIDVTVDSNIEWVGSGISLQIDMQPDIAFNITCTADRVSMSGIEFRSNKLAPIFTVNQIETDIYSNCSFIPEAITPELVNDRTRFMTNKDYNLDTAKFGVLPEVKQSLELNDLATYGSIDLEEVKSMLMTTDTQQTITGRHTMNSVKLDYNSSEPLAALRYSKFSETLENLKEAISDKIKELQKTIVSIPPIGFRYMVIPNFSNVLPEALWPNTQWKKIAIGDYLVFDAPPEVFVVDGRTMPQFGDGNYAEHETDYRRSEFNGAVYMSNPTSLNYGDIEALPGLQRLKISNTISEKDMYTAAVAIENYNMATREVNIGKFTWSNKNVVTVSVWERIG